VLGRRLDRYITAFFLWHFVVCFLAIMGLYVVVDTFAHLDDYVKCDDLGEQVRWVVTYHAYQIPVLVGQFLPIVVLLAGIVALVRLGAYNELNATKAAGVSLHRTLVPMLLGAVAIGALGALDQEALVPFLEEDILRVRGRVVLDHHTYHDLFTFDEKRRTSVMVQTLLNAADGNRLSEVELRPREPEGDSEHGPLPSLRAARALWVDRWAVLFDGTTVAPGAAAQPFARKIVLTDVKAADYSPPADPQAQLADGTPAHVAGAQVDGHPFDLAFAAFEPITRQRMILRGQITGVYTSQPPGAAGAAATPEDGEAFSAPIDITCALWHDKQWLGRAQTYRQITPEKRELKTYDGDPLPLSLAPQELIESRTDPTLKSIPELLVLARRIPTLRQRLLLDVYSRTAFPFASMILLLVALPLLFQQEGGRSTLLGIGLALFVSLGFYVVTYAIQAIGHDPDGIFGGIPWLAAWLPNILFGLAGGYLFWNIDT